MAPPPPNILSVPPPLRYITFGTSWSSANALQISHFHTAYVQSRSANKHCNTAYMQSRSANKHCNTAYMQSRSANSHGHNKYHNPYVKLQEWNIAVSKQSNVCWIGGISHQYLGKCISNDLLLCIHIPQSVHHETDSNSRIELDLFPIIDFGNWNRFPSLTHIGQGGMVDD